MKTKLKEIYEKHKKIIIALIIFTALILLSFSATILSFYSHEKKSNFASNENLAVSPTPTVTIAATQPRDVDPRATDYDKSLDDLKEILRNNKWIGRGNYNIDEGKEYSFSFGKDNTAVISSPIEKEKVLINMKYVKSVIGKTNTYRIVCDLSFQSGKYITDSILILSLKDKTYELKCEDFPVFQWFKVKENTK